MKQHLKYLKRRYIEAALKEEITLYTKVYG